MAQGPRNVPHAGMLLLQLENGFKNTDHIVQEKWAWLTSVMKSFSGHTPRYYKVRGDPTRAVQIAGWNSVEAHFRDFHSSDHLENILEEFGEVLDIRSSWHSDIPFENIQLDAPSTSLIRCHVLKSSMEAFEAQLPAWIVEIQQVINRKVVYGWRCDGGWNDQDMGHDFLEEYAPETRRQFHDDEDQDPQETYEWNLIVPWSSREEHEATINDKQTMKPFFYLFNYVNRMEVFHLDPVELPPMDKSRYDDSDSDDGS